jgi:hypothetical protein
VLKVKYAMPETRTLFASKSVTDDTLHTAPGWLLGVAQPLMMAAQRVFD